MSIIEKALKQQRAAGRTGRHGQGISQPALDRAEGRGDEPVAAASPVSRQAGSAPTVGGPVGLPGETAGTAEPLPAVPQPAPPAARNLRAAEPTDDRVIAEIPTVRKPSPAGAGNTRAAESTGEPVSSEIPVLPRRRPAAASSAQAGATGTAAIARRDARRNGDGERDPTTRAGSEDMAVGQVGRRRADPGQSAARQRPYLEMPLEQLRQRGFLSPLAPRSRIAEEFRGIKRPLLRNIDGKGSRRVEHPNLVMVTSALQGDGKTFSSINLAMSIAMEQDRTVLFVDADVVRATAGKTIGVPPGSLGLIDILDGGTSLDASDVIMRTSMDKLRVLPAGNARDTSTEILASEAMHRFMVELSNRYPDRVIVFDSPPLLLTTESSVLASFMGQIVFVASADITPQQAVQEALEQIGENKIVGVVLNRASRRRSKLLGVGSYGYGYGYGYGDGYGEQRPESGADSRRPRAKNKKPRS